MNHRHLLPNEIDLIVDGEVGFGVAPLKAHLETCPDCRAEVESARLLVHELEAMPHFSLSPVFADKVMSQVQVFEPWHVAALDTVRRWTPAAGPMRVLAAAGAFSSALVLTIAGLWVAARLDVISFFGDVIASRLRAALYAGFGDFVSSIFGEPALAALRASSPAGVLGAAAVLLVALTGAAFGFRAISRASFVRRQQ